MPQEEKVKQLLFQLIHQVQNFPCEIFDIKALAFSIGNVPDEFISGGVSDDNQFTLTLSDSSGKQSQEFKIDRNHSNFQSVLVLLGKIAELQKDQDLQIRQMTEADRFKQNFKEFFSSLDF